MDRRYSLNGTHLTNPVAESTCLNGSSGGQNFPWGATAFTPKTHNTTVNVEKNSSSILQRSKVNQTISPVRAKIDPRIYADVQSHGLASRIVKYHEDGQRLSRSMSVNNIYSKPGQFPIVHLKASKELPYKATNQNVSMTRIAPPKESIYCGNTLSSLLRSSSIVGLQKLDDDLSHENRPILHPPPTENDLAPTRSVIEVLKEISRKRINSDDADSNDTKKKYCNREQNDHVDSHNYTFNNQHNIVPNHQIGTSYKRQRDQLHSPQRSLNRMTITNDQQGLMQHSPEHYAKKRQCTYNNDISSSLSSSIMQSSKRKLNEPVTRSPPATKAANNSQSSNLSDAYAVQKSKILRYHPTTNDLRFDNISKSLSCNTPITPMPATPFSQQSASPVENAEQAIAQRTSSAPVYSSVSLQPLQKHNAKPKLTLFNTKCDDQEEPPEDNNNSSLGAVNDLNDDCGAGIQFIKPKKAQNTTGMKNSLIERAKKSKLASLLAGLRGELYEENNDVVDANTPPKPIVASSIGYTGTTSTPSISCNPLDTSTSVALTMSTNTTNATTTTTSIIGINTLKNKLNTTEPINTPISSTATQPAKNTTPVTSTATQQETNTTPTRLVGTQPTTNTNVVSSGFTFNANQPAKTTEKNNEAPTFNGFKFNAPVSDATQAAPPTTSSTSTVAKSAPAATLNFSMPGSNQVLVSASSTPATATSQTKVKSPLVGLKLTPQTSASAITLASSSSGGGFSFGQTTTANQAVPVLGGFSFSSPNTASTTTSTANPLAATTTSQVTPLFTMTPTSSAAPTTTTSAFAMPANSLSCASTTACVTEITITSTTTSFVSSTVQPQFSFGTPTSNGTSPSTTTTNFGSAGNNVQQTPAFGGFGVGVAQASVSTKPNTFDNTNTPTKPSFGSPTTFGTPSNMFANTNANSTNLAGGDNAVASKNLFSFGTPAGSDQNKPTGTATPFTLNSNSANTTANPIVKPTATTTPFSFGTSNNTTNADQTAAPKPFSFSGPFAGTMNNTAAQQAPATASNNIFGNSAASLATTKAPDTNLFSFGSASASSAPAKPSATVFGTTSNNNTSSPSFSFGGAATANGQTSLQSNSIFGTSSTNNNAPAASGSFSFGNAAVGTSSNIAPDTAKPALFSFGGATNQSANSQNTAVTAPSTNTNIFGSLPAANNVFSGGVGVAGGGTQQNFSFGGAVNNNNTSTTGSTGFGSLGTSANQNKTFTFGSASGTTQDTNKATPATNLFGVSSTNDSNKPFAFGGTTSATSSSPFGKPATTTANQPAPFTFGSTNNNATSSNTPFSFGSSNNNNAANASVGASKPFAFGAPANNTTITAVNGGNANMFSSSGSILGAPPTGLAPATNGNIFAPPPSAQGDRVFRRATRRLHK